MITTMNKFQTIFNRITDFLFSREMLFALLLTGWMYFVVAVSALLTI